jgi:hypothetical protein
MAVDVVFSEVLCFALYGYKRLSKSFLTSVVASFFHDDELANAKSELCKFVVAKAGNIDGWAKLTNKQGRETRVSGVSRMLTMSSRC